MPGDTSKGTTVVSQAQGKELFNAVLAVFLIYE
jgi:hypothetical protein